MARNVVAKDSSLVQVQHRKTLYDLPFNITFALQAFVACCARSQAAKVRAWHHAAHESAPRRPPLAMKPTRNQLLAACKIAPEVWNVPTTPADYLVVFMMEESGTWNHKLISELTSYSELRLQVEIKPRSEAEQLAVWNLVQVPIEPLNDTQRALALAWCCNEHRACVLVPKEGHSNLLVQAVRAQLHINRFEVRHIVDNDSEAKTVTYRDKSGYVRERKEQPTKEVQFLDRGSVLLAFELAGLPAPKSYDDWRLPDGDNVPLTATSSDATLGTMTVHYTNGELALVTSGDGMRAKVVHTKSLRSAAVETLRGLSGRAEGATVRESKEKLTQDEAKSLASKFCRKMKVDRVESEDDGNVTEREPSYMDV